MVLHGINHYYKREGPLHDILYDCVLYFMVFAHYFIMIIVMLFLCGVSVLTAWLLIGILFIMVRTLVTLHFSFGGSVCASLYGIPFKGKCLFHTS